jgi:hypothetical protein
MKSKHYALLLLILLCQTQVIAFGLTPGDYNQKFWGGGLHVWLSYPEDASPGDTIDLNIYVLSAKFPRGNQVESVQVKISVLGATSSNTLYDDTIITNTYLQSGDSISETITVTLPSDSRWYVTAQLDTVSYEKDILNRQEAHVTLDCTEVKTDTYESLEQQNLELEEYLNMINENLANLQTQLDAIPVDEIGSDLQQNYLELMQDYTQLTIRYNLLTQADQTTSNPDLNNQITDLNHLIIQLEDEITSRDHFLQEQTTENNLLNQQINEKEETIETLYIYKETHTVSQDDYDKIQAKLNSSIFTRNIILGSIIIVIAAILFLKYRN